MPNPSRSPSPRSAGPVPDAAGLRQAALAHLARFPASEAGLRGVLDRRIRRWASRALAEGAAAEHVAAQSERARADAAAVASALVESGVLDDAAYAQAKARSLTRSGRSRRFTLTRLAGRGVPSAVAATAMPEDADQELAAAALQARRRRIGPFAIASEDATALSETRAAAGDVPGRDKALAALARAGFSRDVAERTLGLDRAAAELLILALKRG